MTISRTILATYLDPLSEIWLGTAAALGLTVARVTDAYASTNGAGLLTLATSDALDADDSLGQMIFHEICHWLVQGQDAYQRADWGLDNETDDDYWREHACLRLQAVLVRRHGLQTLLAPTTDFRVTFWNGLPDDVLADRQDLSVRLAIAGLARASAPPFAEPLTAALTATRALVDAVAASPAAMTARWRDSMWSNPPPTAPHPIVPTAQMGRGINAPDGSPATCGACAWRYEGGPGRRALRCRQAEGAKIDDATPACERFEPPLECTKCGACCRAAYGAVYVAKRDPFVRKHPALIVKSELSWEIRRDGDHCAALAGGEVEQTALTQLRRETDVHCTVYADRPATCRHFSLGSDHCLTARRRLHFSLG